MYLDEDSADQEHWEDRMTTAFVDFNGVVPEKFDAVRLSHLVDAEYGNQGIDFKMVPREGFGWMNGTWPVPIRSNASSRCRIGSCVPGRAVVPYEPHAPRSRSVHIARGLLRAHNDGRAHGCTTIEHFQRPARPGDGKPHTWPRVFRPGICNTATVILAALS